MLNIDKLFMTLRDREYYNTFQYTSAVVTYFIEKN